MKKIMFFPQNETHVDNMLPIAKLLTEKYDVEVYFLDAQKIYKQNIYSKDFAFNIIEINISSYKAFPLLNFIEKIKIINLFKKEFRKINIDEFQGFIIGNDGALQRALMAYSVELQTFLVLDGIISDYSFSFFDVLKFSKHKISDNKDYLRRKIKFMLNIVFHKLPFNYYLPSDVGNSQVDRIYVISEYVKNILTKQKVNRKKIIVSGMPRYEFLQKLKYKSNNKNQSIVNLLLITQGYSWHNEFENDTYQHLEIKKLINTVNELNKTEKKFNLRIRLHPRDNIENYQYINDNMIEKSNINIYDSLQNSDVILGFNSTVLLEAMHIGKKVIVLMTSGQYWRFKRSFINDNRFVKVFSQIELKTSLEKMKVVNSSMNNHIEYYFNPNSADAHKIIANDIMNGLKGCDS